MDVQEQFPSEIFIEDDTAVQVKQKVVYERKPLYCDKCKHLGHLASKCFQKNANHKVWVIKIDVGNANAVDGNDETLEK